jgi:hypothetical protein
MNQDRFPLSVLSDIDGRSVRIAAYRLSTVY